VPLALGEQLVERHWAELMVLVQPEVVGSLLPNQVWLVVDQSQAEEKDEDLVEHLVGRKIRS